MQALLKLRQAARLIGVSPGRLYRAIADGRLMAAPGGGPGKPTLVSLEALQTFCQREGLPLPDLPDAAERSERSERRAERSTAPRPLPADVNAFMTRLEAFIKQAIATAVDRAVSRLTAELRPRLEAPERSARSIMLRRLGAMRAEGLSLRQIADRLNQEGVPTLSGRGMWRKGSIAALLHELEENSP